ncbi:hypothetical protein [Lacticaseibacillus jixiensis]|uniref:hypothetical protein n=1 Tax=Lacticaseibacillus jixiensis TaxID=3231926 RepID=UPI0036F416C2
MINIEDVKASLRQPASYYIPKAVALINGRRLKGRALKIDGLTLPGKGTFGKIFTALQHNIDVTVSDHQLVVTENDTVLKFVDPQIDVYWLLIHSESYGAISATGPIYHTVLHIVAQPYDFYVQLPGARAATYLVHHPHNLTINDWTQTGSFEEHDSKYALYDQINRVGYAKLVAGTGLEFLNRAVDESPLSKLDETEPQK